MRSLVLYAADPVLRPDRLLTAPSIISMNISPYSS